jgi:hypothetical protein
MFKRGKMHGPLAAKMVERAVDVICCEKDCTNIRATMKKG